MTYIRTGLRDSEICAYTYRGSFPSIQAMLRIKNKIIGTL